MGRIRGNAAGFQLLINGTDIREVNFQGLVTSILVDEHVEKADYCQIKFANVQNTLTFASIFNSGSLLTIRMGWEKDGPQDVGEFILRDPQFILQSPITSSTLVIEGYGKEINLFDSQKRRVFKNRTDSQIVKQIAEENKLIPVVDTTDIKYPQVSQMGISDIEFLRERAQLYGFIVYIEGEELHFHALKPDANVVELSFDPRADNSEILRAEMVLRTIGSAAKTIITGRDKFSKINIKREYGEKTDEVSKRLKKTRKAPIEAQKLVSSDSQAYERFESDRGHLVNAVELENIAFATGTPSQFVIEGFLEAIGDERVRARRIIKLNGPSFNALAGEYYVTGVQHKLDSQGSGFRTFVTFTSSVINNLDEEKNIRGFLSEFLMIRQDDNFAQEGIVAI